ncbi:MAG TPA: PEP/pyruvate-binding domain-containing protein [Polyangia bacterium]
MSGSPLAKISLCLAIAVAACGGDGGGTAAPPVNNAGPPEGECVITGDTPKFLQKIQCTKDFLALSSEPLDASIPGARSVKIVLDSVPDQQIYFQNSKLYKIHYEFASKNLSGVNGKPAVPPLNTFNMTEYYSNARRFTLASLTYYEGPKVWALELAPYDTASAERLERLYNAVAEATFIGKDFLYFHPTSQALERLVPSGSALKVKTTKDLYEKIDYQPLNLASSIGKLRFLKADALASTYVGFRDIVVLDNVPNDISVVAGIITEEFQTPLSHINVLSQNRKTPNMGLRNAQTNQALKKLEGKWVRLTVGGTEYKVEEVSFEESEKWWEANRPKGVTVTPADTSVTGIHDITTIVVPSDTVSLKDSIKKALLAFGGKATHYAAMAQANLVPMTNPKGFAIPVYYYDQFLKENKFDLRIDELLKETAFRSDPALREAKLKELRDQMEDAPVNKDFEKLLMDKIAKEYAGVPLRFRSSSSAEDLDGFSGAGLYTSKTGDPRDPTKPYLKAVKKVWSSVWYFRGFEERDYRGVDQKAVGMALLVHPSFPEEEATGVALTANPFDPSGLQPGFFINVQPGDNSVTLPDAKVTADQFIYLFDQPGKPIVYIDHSSLIPAGTTVLNPTQVFELGQALDKIHKFFRPVYGPTAANPNAWYGLEVDFKFDGKPGEEPKLFIKQARPHPGRGN